jgi:hypothetical protein
MASRRLKSDRFFTDDFRPEVYTQTGIDWVNRTKMKDVILRHYPGARARAGGPAERLPAVAQGVRRRGRPGPAAQAIRGTKKAAEAINA